ncbi:MAG: DUF262 domain-containing protein [Bacteroidales bacterium]|nr:DUF262 domain-containing protein [Bacteroidales bacterium]
MESRTYYGEYTLKHWIDLMLMHNVELPEYQRSFVWEEKDVQRFIKSLKDGQFVQPVTIAHYKDSEQDTNLILDGQQRLTSILLAYLGYFPNKSKFDGTEEFSNDDDSKENDDSKMIIEWQFSNLLPKDKNVTDIEEIRKKIQKDEKYQRLYIEDFEDIENFLETHFLGFSYIIPDTNDSDKVVKFFSTSFRNMNYLGQKLSTIESRRSLYYLNNHYRKYFDGETNNGDDVLCDIKLLENMKPCKIDFVRYLSILSQYSITEEANKTLVGYSSYNSRESFYVDYVSYIVGLEQEFRYDKFDKFIFDDKFPNDCWKERYDKLRKEIQSLKNAFKLSKNAFTSWIDADYWLFGLIYCIVFKNKQISNKEGLIAEISKEIDEKRDTKNWNNYSYQRSPNLLGNLRNRLDKSIKIYEKYEK